MGTRMHTGTSSVSLLPAPILKAQRTIPPTPLQRKDQAERVGSTSPEKLVPTSAVFVLRCHY